MPNADKAIGGSDAGDLTIRKAGLADIALLQELAGTIWREYYPAIISCAQIEYMLARMYSRETIEREILRGTVWEICHREGDEALGFCSYTFDAVLKHVRLHKLYLLPAVHGRGMGRRMLEHVKAASTALGASELRLTVNKGNERAIRAYRRAGFEVLESVVADIGGGYVMDDYVMGVRVGAS